MRTSLRTFVLVLVFTALGATTASGQTIQVLADASDLDDGNGNNVLECLARSASGLIIGYNQGAEAIYSYDPNSSTLSVLRSTSDIRSDISGSAPPVNECDAVTTDDSDNLYFSLRDDNNDNFIYRIDTDGTASSVVVQGLNGARSLEATSSALYVGIWGEKNSSLSNGIYQIPLPFTGNDSPTAVLNGSSISDISMRSSIASDSDGDLFVLTDASSFSKENKVFQVTDPSGSPSISEFADPVGGGSPLEDGEITHIELVNFNGADRIVVSNESFFSESGDKYGVIQMDGSVSVLATASDIKSNTSLSDFGTLQDGGFVLTPNGEIIGASIAIGESTVDGALVSIGGTGLPVELTSFTVETDAQQAVLTWTTATETNNAGFEVQHQAPGAAAWSQIGFEQGAGTTTEARSYRFATDALQPGVHTFRLRQVDTDGTESVSDTRRVEIAAAQAVAFAGPNPVSAGDRPRVTVQLDRAQDVTIRVYNVLGQQVDQLYRGVLPAGEVLEASVSTANLSSGMYFLRVQGPSVNEVKKFTVVK